MIDISGNSIIIKNNIRPIAPVESVNVVPAAAFKNVIAGPAGEVVEGVGQLTVD